MPDAAAVAGMLVNLMLISSSLCCKKIACLQGAQSAVRENASFRQITGIMCDTILAVLSGVAIGFAGLLISEAAMLHKLVLFRYSVVAAILSALAFGIQVVIAAIAAVQIGLHKVYATHVVILYVHFVVSMLHDPVHVTRFTFNLNIPVTYRPVPYRPETPITRQQT